MRPAWTAPATPWPAVAVWSRSCRRARRGGHRSAGRPCGPADAADRCRRGHADPVHPLGTAAARAQGQPRCRSRRAARPAVAGLPGSPTTCRRSPTSISTRSSPGRTGYSSWTHGPRSRHTRRGTRSSAGCVSHGGQAARPGDKHHHPFWIKHRWLEGHPHLQARRSVPPPLVWRRRGLSASRARTTSSEPDRLPVSAKMLSYRTQAGIGRETHKAALLHRRQDLPVMASPAASPRHRSGKPRALLARTRRGAALRDQGRCLHVAQSLTTSRRSGGGSGPGPAARCVTGALSSEG